MDFRFFPNHQGYLELHISSTATKSHFCMDESSILTMNSLLEGISLRTSAFILRNMCGASMSWSFITCSSFDISENSLRNTSIWLKTKAKTTTQISKTIKHISAIRNWSTANMPRIKQGCKQHQHPLHVSLFLNFSTSLSESFYIKCLTLQKPPQWKKSVSKMQYCNKCIWCYTALIKFSQRR